MEYLEADKQKAIDAYNNGSASDKKLLTSLFGKEKLTPPSIMDKVKTADDAFAIKGITIASIVNDNDTIDEIAYKILKVIVEVLNEGWIPDWKNDDQWKYYPWFDLSSGSGLSYGGYGIRGSTSFVGSRLCFKSAELAEYAGKQFIKEYTDFFIIK